VQESQNATSSASGFQYSIIDSMWTQSGPVKTFYSSNKN